MPLHVTTDVDLELDSSVSASHSGASTSSTFISASTSSTACRSSTTFETETAATDDSDANSDPKVPI